MNTIIVILFVLWNKLILLLIYFEDLYNNNQVENWFKVNAAISH